MVAASTPKIYCNSCEKHFPPGDPHLPEDQAVIDNAIDQCIGCQLKSDIHGELESTRKIVTGYLAQLLALEGIRVSGSVAALLTWLADQPNAYNNIAGRNAT